VIDHSCRLILARRSVVRAGAVLRHEVVVGDDCLIGAHCEVVRSVILGPRSYLGHFVTWGQHWGTRHHVAGNVMMANTLVEKGQVGLRYRAARVNTNRTKSGRSHRRRRSHLGRLVAVSRLHRTPWACVTSARGAVWHDRRRAPPGPHEGIWSRGLG